MNKLKVTKDLEKLLKFKKSNPSALDQKATDWMEQLHEMIMNWDCAETYEALSQACNYDVESAVWLIYEIEYSTMRLSKNHPTQDKNLTELRNELKKMVSSRYLPYTHFDIPKAFWEDLIPDFVQLVKEHADQKKPLLDDNLTLRDLNRRELEIRNRALGLGYLKLSPGY